MKDNVDSWLSIDFWRERLRDTVEWAIEAGPRILLIVVLALVALKLYAMILRRLEKRLIERDTKSDPAASVSEHEKRVKTLMGIAQKVGAITIWFMLAMIVLLQIGIDIGPMIAGAGVLGLAVGFGAQELVRDVITGFFMLIENQVRAGDVAQINGTGGVVERIGLRTISLRDLSGTVHVFQNGKVDTIANMTKEWSGAVLDIRVAYKEDVDEVSKVIAEVGRELREDSGFSSKIIADLELFGVDALGDSAVVFKVRFKARPGEQWAVGRELNRRIKNTFDARGIEIPIPHQTVYFGEASPAFKLSMEGEGKKGNGRSTYDTPSA